MSYRLHSDIGLRNDIDRNILFVKNPIESSLSDFVKLIDTPTAIFLALFNGQKALPEVIDIWSKLLFEAIPKYEIYQLVEKIFKINLTPDLAIKDIFIKSNGFDRNDDFDTDVRKFIIDKDKINLSDSRLRIPLRILFVLTFHCPQRCYYCFSSPSYYNQLQLLPQDRLLEIFKEVHELEIDSIDLSGGDPFAYPHIFSLLEILQNFEIKPNIPTKYPLSFDEIKRLRDMGIQSIQISIDAFTPEILDSIVGVSGYSEKIKKTLKNLEKLSIRLRINIVITSFNADDVPNLLNYLTSFDNIYRINFSPYTKSLHHHKNSYFLSQDKYTEVVNKGKEILSCHPRIQFNPGDLPDDLTQVDIDIRESEWKDRSFCSGGRHGFILLPDGKVTMCEELYYHPSYIMGDLSKMSIMEMWNSEEALNISFPDQHAVEGGECKDCEEFRQCHISPGRCVREAIKIYGEERHYFPDPRCPKAPMSATRTISTTSKC